MGNRVSKQHHGQSSIYIRDASGNTMAVYDQSGALKEMPIYGSQRIGMVKALDTEGQFTHGNRQYEYSNHLGNVLAVSTDKMTTVGEHGDLISASNYYPFGLRIGDRSMNSGDYRYGFNGKEDDRDFSKSQLIQDYGFRLYNPALGKFLSVDPLTKSYPMLTPYQFAGNEPIRSIDIDGLERLIVNTDGSTTGEIFFPTDATTNIHNPAPIKKKDNRQFIKLPNPGSITVGRNSIYHPQSFTSYERAAQLGVDIGDIAVGAYKLSVKAPLYLTKSKALLSSFSEIKNTRVALSWPDLHTINSGVPLPSIKLTGGLRSRWISSFGELPKFIEIHHIFPKALKNHRVLRRAGLDIDDVANGIPLRKYSSKLGLADGDHAWHPEYNNYVENALDRLGRTPLNKKSLRENLFKLRGELTE